MTVYLLHFVFHIFFSIMSATPWGAEFVVNMFSTQRLTWLLLSGHLAASVMPAINRKLTVHRQGAYYVAQGRIKKRQLVLPQVTKRSTSQPGLRLLRPQRDFFFPPSIPTKCPSNLECQPPVILEWVWGLVNQVSFEYPGIDAIACQKKKKQSRSASTSRAAAMNSSAQLQSFLLLAENQNGTIFSLATKDTFPSSLCRFELRITHFLVGRWDFAFCSFFAFFVHAQWICIYKAEALIACREFLSLHAGFWIKYFILESKRRVRSCTAWTMIPQSSLWCRWRSGWGGVAHSVPPGTSNEISGLLKACSAFRVIS